MEIIGNLSYNGLKSELYWEDSVKGEIEIIYLGEQALVKGNKHYVIIETTDPVEFTSRIGNLGTLYDYLKQTFHSLEMKVMCLTELAPTFFDEKIKSNLSDVQLQLDQQEFLRNISDLILDDLNYRYSEISDNPTLSLSRASLREQMRQISLAKKFSQARIQELREILSNAITEDSDYASLIKAYLKYGVGACFLITISSQYYYVSTNAIEKAVQFVLKDLKDYDLIIKQRARQGFHLIIQELNIPSLILIRNTILNPNYLSILSKAYPELKPLYEQIRDKFITSLTEDLHLKNKKVQRNLSIIQAVASLLRRSVIWDETTNIIPQPDFEKLPKFSENRRLAFVGLIAGNNFNPTEHLALFDIDQQLPRMMMVAGETGCGKTIASKVIVECCLLHEIPCVVIDPTSQWTGFGKKCEDPSMLNLYKKFGMKTEYARSFQTQCFTSKDSFSIDELLEPNLSVFLIKSMELKEMDEYVYQIVSEIYEYFSRQRESTSVKMVVVTEEAHKLAPREKDAPHKAINFLGVCTRELRKYGCSLIFITQMVKDFAAYLPGGLAIRGNTATKIQMRTGYEGDLNRIMTSYGSEYQKLIPKLPSGVGLVEFSDYGKPYFVCFRPTLTHPFSVDENELKNTRNSRKDLETIGKLLNLENRYESSFSQEEIIFLEALESFNPKNPSISELIRFLKDKIPSIGRIYNIRDELVRKGVIKIIDENGKKKISIEKGSLSGKRSEFSGIPQEGD
jgi:hypothetical protein